MARPWICRSSLVLSAGLSVAACAEEPWTYPERKQESVGAEVFRVFCKRTAREALPNDLEGSAFNEACEGRGGLPNFHFPDETERERLLALIERRTKIVDAIDRALGDDTLLQKEVVTILEQDEITTFLKELIPLYDKPDEVLPTSSRVIADVVKRLFDETDATGKKALEALSQITGRVGYRRADLALGVIRLVLEYPDLDALTESGIKLIARGGDAEKELDEIVRGLALELADYDESPFEPAATLLLVRDFLLQELDQTDQPNRGPVWVVKRDPRGVAVPKGQENGVHAPFQDGDGDGLADVDEHGRLLAQGGSVPAPYRVAHEGSVPRDEIGRAVRGEGDPVYEDFDAQLTMAAAFLREDARLSVPMRDGDRTPFEKLGRGLPALLGGSSKRAATYGKTTVEYEAPDPSTGPLYDLTHAVGALAARHPEVLDRVLAAVDLALRDHEPAMAELVDMMLRVNERGKLHPEAVLVGEQGPGTPHRFWDDLIAVAVRMTKRPGLIKSLLEMILDPNSTAQGALFAQWMTYKDVATYRNAPFTPGNPDGTFTAQQEADLNATAEIEYETLVDRTQPDIGENRSVWQRTMSLMHNLKNRKQCNKEGATLKIILDPTLGPLLNGLGIVLPLSGSGYAECDLYEVPDMARIYSQAILGTAKINLKPVDLQGLGGLGIVDTGHIQEVETQIHGFNDEPTAAAFARYLFAPPNQFAERLTDPPLTKDGVAIKDLEPYALFAMEVKHPSAKPRGQPDHPGLSFIEAGRAMLEAFETHELVDEEDQLVDGYMFAELLSVFHMHWGSRRDEPCAGPPEPTCTQRQDPNGKFFSYQTDLRSYEPLLAEVFGQEGFFEALQDSAQAMKSVKVDGKDGLEILAEFIEVLVKPDEGLTYRDGSTTALTNVGEELGYVSPLYLILDGLKRIDQNFAMAEHADKHETWLSARSDIVDLFLTMEEVDGKKRLKDRVGRSVALGTVDFLRKRIRAHIEAGDVEEWGLSLAPRLASFLDTPLTAGLLHLLDKSWSHPEAGRELMELIAYLVNDQNLQAFEATLVAVTDLFQLLEDTKKIAPILSLAAEAIAPGVTQALHEGGADFSAETGVVRRSVELLNEVMALHKKRPSTLSRVLRNTVSPSMDDGTTPLEALIDVITEVERVQPSQPPSATLTKDDLVAIAKSAHHFMSDEQRGLERLYDVIQNRSLDTKQD